jgi:hypothetical protein
VELLGGNEDRREGVVVWSCAGALAVFTRARLGPSAKQRYRTSLIVNNAKKWQIIGILNQIRHGVVFDLDSL